jgi:hypothetical protein
MAFIILIFLGFLILKQAVDIFNNENYTSVEKAYLTYSKYEATLGLLDFCEAV